MTAATLRERLLAKVVIDLDAAPTIDDAPCWLWSGGHTGQGYGQIAAGGARGKRLLAHRAMWEFWNGPIQAPLHIDHLCRNPQCVNPAHLEAVTNRVNTLRGNTFSGKNAAKTECANGHEYDDANTYVDRRSKRYCRACATDRRQTEAYKAARRERDRRRKRRKTSDTSERARRGTAPSAPAPALHVTPSIWVPASLIKEAREDDRQVLRQRLMSGLIADPRTGCLLWTRSKDRDGYGRITAKGRPEAVHRVAWELENGPIPAGLTIDHVYSRGCRYRHCANVDHLEAVTPTENSMRKRRVRRENGTSKITEIGENGGN